MDIREQLKRSGIPPGLIPNALLEVVYQPHEKKYATLKAMAEEKGDARVFLITGEDCPQKDQFCAAFMKWYMLKHHTTGSWSIVPDSPDSPVDWIGAAGITVIPATYLLSPLGAKQLATVVRDKQSRAFVLCSKDLELYNTTFGEEFMNFISHISLMVNLPTPRAAITVI